MRCLNIAAAAAEQCFNCESQLQEMHYIGGAWYVLCRDAALSSQRFRRKQRDWVGGWRTRVKNLETRHEGDRRRNIKPNPRDGREYRTYFGGIKQRTNDNL